MIITIDGPAASGKSSAAQLLAQQIGFIFLSSGMIYRALAYILARTYGFTLQQLPAVDTTLLMTVLNQQDFKYTYDCATGKASVTFKGEDITPFLKEEWVDTAASVVSVNPNVREQLTAFQRAFALQHNVVVEGRDAGSVVFPHAQKKIFLTASSAVRALRWQSEQIKKGNTVSLHDALHILQERDQRDQQRNVAPLIIPQDALVIDNSQLTLQETVQRLKSLLA